MTRFTILGVILLVATVYGENLTGLDAISNYTAFSFQTFHGYDSQCNGPIYAKNISINSYTVGLSLPSDCSVNGLVAEKYVELTSGSVNGNITYGVSASLNEAGYSCGAYLSPLNFNITQTIINLYNTSQTLALYPPTGLALQQNQHLIISGTNSDINVFSISKITIESITELTIDVPKGSYAYINVGGQETTVANMEIDISNTTSLDYVLFNFPDSKYLLLENVGFLGSILAPNAFVNFTFGSLNGGIISQNFSGNPDLEYLPFVAPDCICAPCSPPIGLPDYSLFTLENTTFYDADIGGQLVVGGNCSLSHLTIGDQLNSSFVGFDLIVNQSLSFNSGSANSILVRGDANITDVSYQTLSFGASDIDYRTTFANLQSTSQYVSQFATNGIVVSQYNEMKLIGDHLSLNIFTLTPNQLVNITEMLVTAPSQSWVVINIGGSNTSIRNMNMIIDRISKQRILWNFYETEDLYVENINVLGSILAPQSFTTLQSGTISGSIACKAIYGTGSITYNPWIPFTPPCAPCSC